MSVVAGCARAVGEHARSRVVDVRSSMPGRGARHLLLRRVHVRLDGGDDRLAGKGVKRALAGARRKARAQAVDEGDDL